MLLIPNALYLFITVNLEAAACRGTVGQIPKGCVQAENTSVEGSRGLRTQIFKKKDPSCLHCLEVQHRLMFTEDGQQVR